MGGQPTPAAPPTDWTAKLLADAAYAKNSADINAGNSAASQAVGLGAAQLAKEGVPFDPNAAAGLGTASFFIAPELVGLRAVKAAGGTFDLVNGAGKVLGSAPSASVAGAAVEAVANGMNKLGGKLDAVGAAAIRKVIHDPVAIGLGVITGAALVWCLGNGSLSGCRKGTSRSR
jgi:hypothetical protein